MSLFTHSLCVYSFSCPRRQAIDCCLRVRPDLLLLDIHMPVKDGMEAACELRAMPQFERLPIVAISADQFAPDDQVYLRDRVFSLCFELALPLSVIVFSSSGTQCLQIL